MPSGPRMSLQPLRPQEDRLATPTRTLPPQNPHFPALAPFRPALYLALAFALLKLAVHIVANLLTQHFGYGIFRDELYYFVCGRHLAWGYVDQAPMVAMQARLAEMLFGLHNQAMFRIFSALAGSVTIVLTGMLAWSFGGKRSAQALAMTAVLFAPVYLGIDGFLSMNSFGPVFWMGCLLTVIWIVRGASPRWWLLFGVLGGLGLLNKPDMAFFLVALLAGLLLTPQRRLLWNGWVLAAITLLFLIASPYLLWQFHHHWPTYVWLENVAHSHKNVVLAPLPFLGAQIMMLAPWNIFLLLPGLFWIFAAKAARGLRWIGATYLVFLVLMVHLHAKDYYLAPIYPVLFAAGALAWQRMFSGPRRTAWLLPAWCAFLVIAGLIVLPMALPVLPPYTWVRYATALHLRPSNTETAATGPLPQFYADRFGWKQMVAQVARIYNALSPNDRAQTAIFCDNYGEAAAIDLYGAQYGLPQAISGHQNYFFWGPRGHTGAVMIIVGNDDRDLDRLFQSVQVVGHIDDPLAMPYENGPIYLCRGLKQPLATLWPKTKHWM